MLFLSNLECSLEYGQLRVEWLSSVLLPRLHQLYQAVDDPELKQCLPVCLPNHKDFERIEHGLVRGGRPSKFDTEPENNDLASEMKHRVIPV